MGSVDMNNFQSAMFKSLNTDVSGLAAVIIDVDKANVNGFNPC